MLTRSGINRRQNDPSLPMLEQLQTEENVTNELSRSNNQPVHVQSVIETTDNATTEMSTNDGTQPQSQTTTNMEKLIQILANIDKENQKDWIKELYENIKEQMSRIPKGGWEKIKDAFNQKFVQQKTIIDMRNLYNMAKNKDNLQSGQNNVPTTSNQLIEIKNVDLFTRTKTALKNNIKEVNEQNKMRTYKIYSREVKNEIMDYINIALQQEQLDESIISLQEYANIILACQITYQQMTTKTIKKSNWQQSMEETIKKLYDKVDTINEFCETGHATSAMKQICKNKHIHSTNRQKVERVKDELEERIKSYEKRLRIHENRKQFRKTNRLFELNAKRFYREINETTNSISNEIDKEATYEFWKKMWEQNEMETNREEIVNLHEPSQMNIDMCKEKICEITENVISNLPLWKATGTDYVFNFYIKKIHVLHTKLKELVYNAIQNPQSIDEQFYEGVTYLLPKRHNTKSPNDLRPITCLSNIYKLISKVATQLLTEFAEVNEIISNNQLGTKRRCQGAKLQALINKVINSSNDHKLCTSWIDIQKAYDSVPHSYMLFANDKNTLKELCDRTKEVLEGIGFQTNEQKSANNIGDDTAFGNMIDENGYRYLGILEDENNLIKTENKVLLREKILSKVDALCKTKLNGKNLMMAINQYAISTMNYYIGLIDFKPNELKSMDDDIRRILKKYNIIRHSANNERLYMDRKELGRGLQKIEERAEAILFNFHSSLEQNNKAIIDNEIAKGTSLGTIKTFITNKYQIPDSTLNAMTIKEKQKADKLEKIREKRLHGKLFNHGEQPVNIEQSSLWLKKSNISPQEEGLLCKVQDRNLFFETRKCKHCSLTNVGVDHLATCCGRLLNSEYKYRHNDVVRSLHLMFCQRYGIERNKRLKNYRVENVIQNNRVKIKSDVPIITDTRIDNNKPDLLVHDLAAKKIWIVEVGITNKDRLKETETEKARKYDILAKELKSMYNATVFQVPIVMTWDGLTTKYHKKYMEILNVPKQIQAYVQYISIKRTAEIIFRDLTDICGGFDDVQLEKIINNENI
uniref:Uncharacterized protein LOC113789754 n=1 Tax=Dermatophagoides pteronyssinus TaxID=6956 RepID=A0A6P6XNT3_DERPT|nr:uncharacterized protein LOC113789754 [Dermatophagoides pteronyssinus]